MSRKGNECCGPGVRPLLELRGERPSMKNDLLHDNQLRSLLFQMPAAKSGRGATVCSFSDCVLVL